MIRGLRKEKCVFIAYSLKRMQSDSCHFYSLFTAIECITLKVVYADVNASLTSKQAELILLVACGIFRGCGFKECVMI